MDRRELADFLRNRRERLAPEEVGVARRPRSRTNGLRRDDVADLAGISTDYYTRLEQARGSYPSTAVLAGLARALRLTDDERDHLFLLAGQAAPQHGHPSSGHVGPGLLHMLDHLHDVSAFVSTDTGEMLVQTPMAKILMGDVASWRAGNRNFYRYWFTDPASRERVPEADQAQYSRSHVDELRAVATARRGDPDVEALVDELRGRSEEFDELWRAHTVAVRRSLEKRMIHPEVGTIDLVCEVMVSAINDQRLIVHFPRPGTDAAEKLDLLRVIGGQRLGQAPTL